MRPVMIELTFEGVELSLLSSVFGSGQFGGLVLERVVHASMLSILLRLAGFDELRKDAQAHPPGRQAREATEGMAGKGNTVVGANASR